MGGYRIAVIGFQAGHAGATLEGVDLALQVFDKFLVAELVAPGIEQGVAAFQHLVGLFQEDGDDAAFFHLDGARGCRFFGVLGLYMELSNPGGIFPGVVGAICLLIALYAFQMLPVNYAGLGLILLGILLMIAEVMVPSFGVLGIGGIIAMVIGSIILIDTDAPGFAVSRSLIGAVAGVGSLGLMAIIWFAIKARQRPVVSGREQLVGEQGSALESFEGRGEVFVHSERWSAVSDDPVSKGQGVEVTGVDGLP